MLVLKSKKHNEKTGQSGPEWVLIENNFPRLPCPSGTPSTFLTMKSGNQRDFSLYGPSSNLVLVKLSLIAVIEGAKDKAMLFGVFTESYTQEVSS